jgi:hypothetical protein
MWPFVTDSMRFLSDNNVAVVALTLNLTYQYYEVFFKSFYISR